MRVLSERLVSSKLEVLIAITEAEGLLSEFERQGFRGLVVDTLRDADPHEYSVLVVDPQELPLCSSFMSVDTIIVSIGKNPIGPYDVLMNLDVQGKYSIIGMRPLTNHPTGYVGV